MNLFPPQTSTIPIPRACIEILRGIAEHRVRRVASPVFLIGSAPDCDLVLGDPTFPEIQSYLLVSSERPRSEVVLHRVAGPMVSVQGDLIESAEVHDGAVIRIEGYLLQLHLDASAANVVRRGQRPHRSAANLSDLSHDLRIFRDSA